MDEAELLALIHAAFLRHPQLAATFTAHILTRLVNHGFFTTEEVQRMVRELPSD